MHRTSPISAAASGLGNNNPGLQLTTAQPNRNVEQTRLLFLTRRFGLTQSLAQIVAEFAFSTREGTR